MTTSDPTTASPAAPLLHTPLHALHLELGAKMVPFAGYSMPVSYPQGILAEHRLCRESAVLFDVSHMGQLRLTGEDAAAALETLVPVDITGLAPGKQRYALFTNDAGGILDDLMVTRREDHLFLVVNAACKEADTAHLRARLSTRCLIEPLPERGLLALQGPKAAAVMARLAPELARLTFMTGGAATIHGIACFATRSGYTGEDGFEISVPAADAEAFARKLLAHPAVKPVGLGARDTLRLEAGLHLHGQDMDSNTTVLEASLAWAIAKSRRAGGRKEGGFPGAGAYLQQLLDGTTRRLVGLVGDEAVPIRHGAELVASDGASAGAVTSGTISPSTQKAIMLGYVNSAYREDSRLFAMVRDARRPVRITKLPFVPKRYKR